MGYMHRVCTRLFKQLTLRGGSFNGIASLIALISAGPHAHREGAAAGLLDTAYNLTDNPRAV